jgi:hypothetical protein
MSSLGTRKFDSFQTCVLAKKYDKKPKGTRHKNQELVRYDVIFFMNYYHESIQRRRAFVEIVFQ